MTVVLPQGHLSSKTWSQALCGERQSLWLGIFPWPGWLRHVEFLQSQHADVPGHVPEDRQLAHARKSLSMLLLAEKDGTREMWKMRLSTKGNNGPSFLPGGSGTLK